MSKGKDSACELKSLILRGGLAHLRLVKSLRPPLESSDFSSTILESQSSNENYKSCREQTALPNIQSRASSTATPRILDSKSATQSSLRESKANEAIHTNTQKIDSSVDCHAIATAWACNDRSNAAFQKVDSSNEAQNHKTRKEQQCYTIFLHDFCRL